MELKDRKTAAQLRAEQEQREAAAQAAQKEAEEAARKQRADREQVERRGTVEKLKAGWRDAVDDAAKRDKVRFLVVAEVISDAERLPEFAELKDALSVDGFSCELVSLQNPGRRVGNQVSTPYEVTCGGDKGWMPAVLPQFGRSGTVRYLIVRW